VAFGVNPKNREKERIGHEKGASQPWLCVLGIGKQLERSIENDECRENVWKWHFKIRVCRKNVWKGDFRMENAKKALGKDTLKMKCLGKGFGKDSPK